jgi:heme oxygenase (biliverdin-IX-beta and delta-forming)
LNRSIVKPGLRNQGQKLYFYIIFHKMKKVTDVLKTACREVHLKTEKSLVLKLKSINSVSDYADILTIFYGYFAPLENKIEEHITVDILPDILSRKRSSFIISDLHTLGYQVPIPVA